MNAVQNRSTKPELWNCLTNVAYMISGTTLFYQAGWLHDVAILQLAGVQCFLGVGSFLFHWTGYHLFWILDNFPIVLTLLLLSTSLAERLIAESFIRKPRPLVSGCLYFLVQSYFWVLFALSVSYFIINTAPRAEDMPLSRFTASKQIAVTAGGLGVVILLTLLMAFWMRADDPARFIGLRGLFDHVNWCSLEPIATILKRPIALIIWGTTCFVLAFVLRTIETSYYSYNPACDYPGAFLLHGAWHLLSAIGFYFISLFISLFRAKSLDEQGFMAHYTRPEVR